MVFHPSHRPLKSLRDSQVPSPDDDDSLLSPRGWSTEGDISDWALQSTHKVVLELAADFDNSASARPGRCIQVEE